MEILATPKIDTNADAIIRAMQRLASLSRVRAIRPVARFAEEEIVLSTGPFAGLHFRISRQPWSALWLKEIDNPLWRRFLLTGPSQSGKTLAGSAIPLVHTLMELRETAIYGAPTIDICADKWRQDILPIIERSRYRDLLPSAGRGSKGGTPTAIQFRHGPTLKFMSGGGGDKTRAHFTARVAVITETDGMDTPGGSSRETDKIGQIEARTNSYGDRSRIFLECTVSTEVGRTWKELKGGSDSRLILPCPHCAAWVTPDRQHLAGWQDAESAGEARDAAAIFCPACGVVWTEAQRVTANNSARLIHRGQEVVEGAIVGLMARTPTFSMRFTAANNLLMPISRVGEEEWGSPRTSLPELGEKKLRQYFWALPTEAETVTTSETNVAVICARVGKFLRGRVPDEARNITVAADVGKWLIHWVAVAWLPDGSPHVLDYGRVECPSREMAEELAILNALRQLRDEIIAPGWLKGTTPMHASVSIVDSGNWESTVVGFCAESGPGWYPSKGFGVAQLSRRKIASDPGYEVVKVAAGHSLVEINSDFWKSWVQLRLQTPMDQAGALKLFQAPAQEHLSFAKHLTAERCVEDFIAGRGLVTRWEVVSRTNHFLDALVLACVGGHAIGEARIVANALVFPEPAPARQASQEPPPNYVNAFKGRYG